jgi:glucosylceramidase
MKKMSIPIAAMCLSMTAAVIIPVRADTTFVIVSGKDNYWKSGTVAEGTGGTTVTVNVTSKKQAWQGFGGCFNEAGWDALKALNDQGKQDQAMKLLFDKKDGIGFPWGRIPIGASDYALSRYTLDDGTGDDLTMSRFSIARDKGCLIPFIKAAQALKPGMKFWASPWTPPPWMKKGAFDAAGYDGGTMRNEANVLKAHALYFSKFITAYVGEGIPINAVCPQNEPGYTRAYPTCGWGPYNFDDGKGSSGDKTDPEYLSTFTVDHLYPQLQADHPKTEIWFGTLSNSNTAPSYWSGVKTKAGSNSKTIIKGLGLQWNNVGLVGENTAYLPFCSEHQCGNYYWKTEVTNVDQADSVHFLKTMAPNNHAYGEESWDLIKKWVEAGVVSYNCWNMILDTKGLNLNTAKIWPQNSLLAVNRDSKALVITPYYYVVRHLAQYVDTGAYRVATSGGNALAFLNPDGGVSVAVSNNGAAATMTVSVNSKSYKFSHPGKGWATLYTGPWPPAWYKTTTSAIPQNRLSRVGEGLKVTCKAGGYRIALPSRQSGRIELLTATGRVLASRAIPQGSGEIYLPKQASHAGMLLVRVVNGGTTTASRLINAQ